VKFAIGSERHGIQAGSFSRDGDVEIHFSRTPFIYSCGNCGHSEEDAMKSLSLILPKIA
jgi:hypothetical protein